VTSITAYRKNNSDYGSDSDYNSLEFLENVFQDVAIKTFTQELRVDTSIGDKVDLLVGGYYFNEDIEQDAGIEYGEDTRTYIDILAGGPATLAGVEDALGFARGTFFSDETRVLETFTQDNEAYSFFGTADFNVTDRLTATVGLNYTKDKKQVSIAGDNTDVFGNLSLNGADGAQVLTVGGLAANFPAFAQSCIDPSTGAPFGALPFTAANAGAVSMSPACFLDPTDLTITAPGSVAFPGFQAAVAAGVVILMIQHKTRWQVFSDFSSSPNNWSSRTLLRTAEQMMIS